MLTGIDHLVVLVPDLDTAIRNYTQLGFTVVPGGQHPTGTHNALIGFQDGAYIELIAFREPRPEHRWYWAVEAGGGLIDYCLATDNLHADLEVFRAAGVPMSEPSPLARTRPDGYRLDWVLSMPPTSPGIFPFLIEDKTPRSERVPKETTHPNGVTGIKSLTMGAPSDDAFAPLAGMFGVSGSAIMREDLSAAGWGFTIGTHRLNFLAPFEPAGALHDWIRAGGRGVHSAKLLSASQTGDLDLALTFNAQFMLENATL
jgi:catechol 2,3-dioxygenase-like lactoylglutathione lyase family enzyme